MPVSNAIAGLEILQRALNQRTTRQFDLEKAFKEHGYKLDQEKAKQELEAAREALQRQGREKVAKITSGPGYQREALKREEYERGKAGDEASALLGLGSPLGQTPAGKQAYTGAFFGKKIDPDTQKALAGIDMNSTVGWLALQTLANSDPVLKATLVKALRMSGDLNYWKAYSSDQGKLNKSDPKKSTPYNFKVSSSLQEAVKSVIEGINPNLDADKPIFPQLTEAEGKDAKMTIIGAGGKAEVIDLTKANFAAEFTRKIVPYIADSDGYIAKEPAGINTVTKSLINAVGLKGMDGLNTVMRSTTVDGEEKYVTKSPLIIPTSISNSNLIETTRERPKTPDFPANFLGNTEDATPQPGMFSNQTSKIVSLPTVNPNNQIVQDATPGDLERSIREKVQMMNNPGQPAPIPAFNPNAPLTAPVPTIDNLQPSEDEEE